MTCSFFSAFAEWHLTMREVDGLVRRVRMTRSFLLGFLVGLAVFGEAAAQDHAASRLFSSAGDYPLGASVNRTDYESIDPAARRLYISKMGGGQLLVFDIDKNRLVAQL